MEKPIIGVTPLWDEEKKSYWMLPGYLHSSSPLIDKSKEALEIRVPLCTWYARLDSNQRPSESESDALSNCATGAYLNYVLL